MMTMQRISSPHILTLCAFIALLLGGSPLVAQSVTFEDISPDNSDTDDNDPDGATGGRVNGLATVAGNNETLYAASEWGGIYRSDTAGLTWDYLPGHNPQATWDVEVDPSNANRVYATSFFDGRLNSVSGINVSTDGGATWNHPATANPPAAFCANVNDQTERAAYGISIDPNAAANVFIGTSCGLAVSNDSGVTWTFRDPTAGDGATRIWDVLALGNGVVHVCGDDGHLRSGDGGATWVAGSGLPSGRCRLAGSPDEAYVLFAVVGTTIYETDNADDGGGASWTQTRVNPAIQGRIPFVATNPRGTVRGPSGTYDLWFGDVQLHRVGCTTPASPAPGGSPRCGTGNIPPWIGPFTRSAGGHDDTGDLVFDSEAANDACPQILASDGGVYWNTDATADCHNPDWEQPNVTPHGLWPFAMSGSGADGGDEEDLYFGNQDNGLFGATDVGEGTATWHNDVCCDGFDAEGDPDGGVYSICCFGGSGPANRVFRTERGFFNAQEITAYPPGGRTATFDFPDSIHHYGGGRYAMITRNCTFGAPGCPSVDGGVFTTDDIGADPVVWTEIGADSQPGAADFCAIYVGLNPSDEPTYFVQRGSCNQTNTTDEVFRFSPGPGSTWQQITLPEGGFGVFAVHPTDPDRLLASGQTSSGGGIYQSSDGGDSWTSVPALDALMTGGGEFPYKNNRGPTNFTGQGGYWQPSLLAFDDNSDLMVAGGQDSGIFLSQNGGATWELISNPFTDPVSVQQSPPLPFVPHIPRPRYAFFDTDEGVQRIFIGSQGRGIWRLTVTSIFSDGFESGDTAAWSNTVP